MILCIDCGNTRLKWGLYRRGTWQATGHLALEEVNRLADVLPGPPPARIVACNVAGPAISAAVERSVARPVEWIVARASQCGVVNRYELPDKLGADRWAALIGARALHQGACLVVCSGTATTIDLLDAAGVFQGGLILPGLDLMHAALAGRTAQLDATIGHSADLPRNTRDAITSGTIHATLGAMERMFRLIAMENGAICMLSGGAATRLEALLTLPWRRIDTLVLEGLARIAAGPSDEPT